MPPHILWTEVQASSIWCLFQYLSGHIAQRLKERHFLSLQNKKYRQGMEIIIEVT